MRSRHWIWTIVMATLALTLMWACGTEDGDNDPTGEPCETVRDCIGGQICDNVSKTCMDMVFCTTHDQCAPSGFCRSNHCEPATACTASTECEQGFECATGYCLPSSTADGDVVGCTSDAQCAFDQYCQLSTGTCLPRSSTDGDYATDGDTAGDPCDPNPCTAPNKSVCTASGDSAVCSCDSGYVDDGEGNCVQQSTDPCNPNPCTEANKTVCTPSGSTYVCSCDTGYHEESGVCVADSTGGTCKAKFCLMMDAATLSGYGLPATLCMTANGGSMSAGAQSCGACVEHQTGVDVMIDLTDCAGTSLMDGGAQPLGGPFNDGEDYVFVLKTDGSITILTVDTTQGVSCDDVTYDDVVANVGRRSGVEVLDTFWADFE